MQAKQDDHNTHNTITTKSRRSEHNILGNEANIKITLFRSPQHKGNNKIPNSKKKEAAQEIEQLRIDLLKIESQSAALYNVFAAWHSQAKQKKWWNREG